MMVITDELLWKSLYFWEAILMIEKLLPQKQSITKALKSAISLVPLQLPRLIYSRYCLPIEVEYHQLFSNGSHLLFPYGT